MKPMIGSIVAFYQARQFVLGQISAEENGRYHVAGESEDFGLFSAVRFVLQSSVSYPVDASFSSLVQFRIAIAEDLPQIAAMDFSFLDKAALALGDIAETLHLNTDSSIFALYIYLKDQPQLFAHKKEVFRLMTAAEQLAFEEESAVKQERSSYLNEVRAFLDGSMISDSSMATLFAQLPEIILDNKHRDLQRILHEKWAELSTEEAVYKLRIMCGELTSIVDPAIADAGIPVGFSPALVTEELLPVSLQLSNVSAFSIDDEDTRDYDDAISFVPCAEGWILGIHVSAVALRISIDSSLYDEMMKRVSSLYSANVVVPLLPPVYSEQELSLISDSERAVFSLYLTLDKELAVMGSELRLDSIQISRNYSYREVDKAIQSNPFNQLLNISNKLKEARQSSHSRDKQRFYYYFKEVRGVLQLRRVDNESPARLIVEELMIAFNSSFAEYAVAHGCPMIYRNINRYESENDDNPASQAYLSTAAAFHPGIGASAYLHASSPIRRVTDLINQYQMLALLENTTPPFDDQELQDAIIPIEKRLLLLREVGHRSQRYWCLKYIEEQCLQVPLDACYRGETQGKFRLEIIPWGMQVLAICDSCPRTTAFKLIVYEVDWKDWTVKADIV